MGGAKAAQRIGDQKETGEEGQKKSDVEQTRPPKPKAKLEKKFSIGTTLIVFRRDREKKKGRRKLKKKERGRG